MRSLGPHRPLGFWWVLLLAAAVHAGGAAAYRPIYCPDITPASMTYTYRQTAELSRNELKGDCAHYLEPSRGGAAFVAVMLRHADNNRDGRLSRAEVTRAWRALSFVVRAVAESACMNDESMFAKCDADRDGYITAHELAFVNGCFDSCRSRYRVFKHLA